MYVPGLQYEAGLVGFVHRQLGLPIAATAPLGKISDGFEAWDRHLKSKSGTTSFIEVPGGALPAIEVPSGRREHIRVPRCIKWVWSGVAA